MAGLTHMYFGDGKGKTTAALGLALRASGSGQKVVIVQFLKDWKISELNSLALIPNITVFRGKASGGVFVKDMTDEQRAQTKAIHNENLQNALELQKKGECDMLVLDEGIDAYRMDLIDIELFDNLLDKKPEELELVITGHRPPRSLLERADYVTEMVKRKHPYDQGIAARRGVEF